MVAEEAPIGPPNGRDAGAPLDLNSLSNRPAAGRADPQPGALAAAQCQRAAAAAVRDAAAEHAPQDEYDLAYGYVLRKDYAVAERGLPQLHQEASARAPAAGRAILAGREPCSSASTIATRRNPSWRCRRNIEQSGKAPESLLRLGQSLAALKQQEAACATLAEVDRKYPRASASVKRSVASGTEACPLLRPAPRLGCPKLSTLFSDLADFPALILAVSGGPDSTALMLLLARWRAARQRGPKLIAVTVDHGLRPEAKREAAAVARLARKLKLAHRTLRWRGAKPKTGLQQAARQARYRLLAQAASDVGASHIVTAHTRDDQAETVLIRMAAAAGSPGLPR